MRVLQALAFLTELVALKVGITRLFRANHTLSRELAPQADSSPIQIAMENVQDLSLGHLFFVGTADTAIMREGNRCDVCFTRNNRVTPIQWDGCPFCFAVHFTL